MARNILVTGGTGYIGSHTVVELLEAGFTVTVVDNLENSKVAVLDRIEEITGRRPAFHRTDVRDRDTLRRIFDTSKIDAVVHFAGLKAVGESVQFPLRYYDNNIGSTLSLCEVMTERGVKGIVFSSSATVYGETARVPIREDAPLQPINPYGRTKLMNEEILGELYRADPSWKVVLLRYFNPVGAHESGLIGEEPRGIPNNLMPYITQVAVGMREKLFVFGSDYPTYDGTGVRDYIHVVDLARGHVKALEWLFAEKTGALLAVNLGTGRGYSVLEVIRAFERASGREIPYEIVGRRPGDVAVSFADPTRAEKIFNWRAVFDMEKMCTDSWRWQSRNPQGYPE